MGNPKAASFYSGFNHPKILVDGISSPITIQDHGTGEVLLLVSTGSATTPLPPVLFIKDFDNTFWSLIDFYQNVLLIVSYNSSNQLVVKTSNQHPAAVSSGTFYIYYRIYQDSRGS